MGFKEAAEPEIVLPSLFVFCCGGGLFGCFFVCLFLFFCFMEKGKEFQKNIYFCFTDYPEAFDCVGYNKLWKILKEMGISDHLTCLLKNLSAGQEATVRTKDWFKIGKGAQQDCILSPCLFNLYAQYIM